MSNPDDWLLPRIRSRKIIDIVFCSILTVLDDAWVAEYHTMVGNIAVHIGIGRDQHIISNRNVSYDGRIRSDPDLAANFGCAFSDASVLLTNGHTFVNIAIFSNAGFRIDRNIIRMAKIQSFSDAGRAGQLNAPFILQSGKDKSVPVFQYRMIAGLTFSKIIEKAQGPPPPRKYRIVFYLIGIFP